jgi:hypothetical protein
MKSLLIIPLFLFSVYSFGQMTVSDIKDKTIQDRVNFLKSKTDSFLLSMFSKTLRQNFKFEFTNCGFFMGEMREIYQFLNSRKFEPTDINNLTHNYSFFDKKINLKTSLDIYLYQDNNFEIQFQKTIDSLTFLSLDKIYNKGLLQKIMTKIKESKFKQHYTEIQIDNKTKTFNIVLKDGILPHKYFIY